jgi:hypothetical protein
MKNLKNKELALEKRRRRKHNYLLKTKYFNYDIPKIADGCCPICGTYHCNNEFCKKHNFQQLIGLVNRYGLNPKAIGTSEIFNEFYRIRDLLYNLYWNEGLSGDDLSIRFNVPYTTIICQDFKVLEIPKRNFEESTRNSINKGKRDIPSGILKSGFERGLHQNWHTTWAGEEVFLRSSYESNYANYLDENNISYSVEELRIEYFDTQQNKTRVAVPDFYITSTNEIVEIKSDFTLDIQEMQDKFKAYTNLGYIPKLILEGKEVDIYKIEEEVDEKRLNKIKTKNINSFKNNEDSDID